MYGLRRKKFTLMPLIALATLSLAITVPALSATVHAAAPVRYATVMVQPGDNLWKLAEKRTTPGEDVQVVVDQIVAANHLGSAAIAPGQLLRIPEPRQHIDPDRERLEAFLKSFKVLERKHGGGRQHGHLLAIPQRFECRAHYYFRLAKAYVAAQ